MSAGKILLIDDEIEIRGFLQNFFEENEYDVLVANNGEEGWEKFQQGSYDLVVCDMMMPKMLGIEVLRRIREKVPTQKVIMLTGVKEQTMVDKAKALGCKFYLNKPFSLKDLGERVEECFKEK